jgi:hypothetical protein
MRDPQPPPSIQSMVPSPFLLLKTSFMVEGGKSIFQGPGRIPPVPKQIDMDVRRFTPRSVTIYPPSFALVLDQRYAIAAVFRLSVYGSETSPSGRPIVPD